MNVIIDTHRGEITGVRTDVQGLRAFVNDFDVQYLDQSDIDDHVNMVGDIPIAQYETEVSYISNNEATGEAEAVINTNPWESDPQEYIPEDLKVSEAHARYLQVFPQLKSVKDLKEQIAEEELGAFAAYTFDFWKTDTIKVGKFKGMTFGDLFQSGDTGYVTYVLKTWDAIWPQTRLIFALVYLLLHPHNHNHIPDLEPHKP
jgi:hypothetical protein